jgi:hypothetical protein
MGVSKVDAASSTMESSTTTLSCDAARLLTGTSANDKPIIRSLFDLVNTCVHGADPMNITAQAANQHQNTWECRTSSKLRLFSRSMNCLGVEKKDRMDSRQPKAKTLHRNHQARWYTLFRTRTLPNAEGSSELKGRAAPTSVLEDFDSRPVTYCETDSAMLHAVLTRPYRIVNSFSRDISAIVALFQQHGNHKKQRWEECQETPNRWNVCTPDARRHHASTNADSNQWNDGVDAALKTK